MRVDPPATPKELDDLRRAIRAHIPEAQYLSNQVWFDSWFQYLIGLRRGYQSRWLSEAYNEHSSST